MPQGADSDAAGNAKAREGGSRAFELLRSKLDPPVQRPGLVDRARLVDAPLARAQRALRQHRRAARLRQDDTCSGSGRRRTRVPSPGCRSTTGDNDPVVLLTYIAEALNADGSIDPSVFKALVKPGDSVWAHGLPRLGAAFAAREEPVVLVLDDVHELDDPQCLDALVALALHVPVGSQLVFSGRTEAHVGLATMRADRELLEVGNGALALSDAEAHLLITAAGAELSTTEAAELNQRAEGWAAGLYLAALSIAGGNSSPASFRGDDRFVTDYLRAEELSRAGPEEAEFLLRSSVLEKMCGSLCDAVLERTGSAAMLEQLESENLFVVALDHTRTGYRYHHLFQEMLQAELVRRDPELVSALNRRAAAWCEANGRTEDAIEYAAAAGDTDALARIVTANVFPYYRSGRVTTVERWLTSFDDQELLGRYPTIAVFGAWLHALRGRPEAAERWALAVEEADHDDPMPDGSTFDAWAATVRALLCRNGVETDAGGRGAGVGRARDNKPVAARHDPAAGDRDAAGGRTGTRRKTVQRRGGARPARGRRSGRASLHIRSSPCRALARGDETAAEAEVARAGDLVDDALSADYVVTAIQLAATARLALARGQGARARQALASCPAPAAEPDARPALALRPGQARARESAPRPRRPTGRRHALPRGGRHPAQAPLEARHARRRGGGDARTDHVDS